jgi:hypothetical protein
MRPETAVGDVTEMVGLSLTMVSVVLVEVDAPFSTPLAVRVSTVPIVLGIVQDIGPKLRMVLAVAGSM